MKKHHSVQGTFSRLFGKRHASPAAASLFATNPPWIFTQEVTAESAGGTGDVIEVYYGDNRFGTMTDSGTATLKPRPRVRPLLTFLPLNAQESHGVAVPTPSVPEDFEEKAALGSNSQINGNYRMYSSVGDLRPQALEGDDLDEDIPPPPSVPPPPPPTAPAPAPPCPASPVPPPPEMLPPPPEMLPPPPPPPEMVPPPEIVPPPPAMAAPPPPASALSSPGTPAPPDFIPPAPLGASPLSRAPAPFTTGISKWKSETVLNTRQADAEGPLHPAEAGVPAAPGPKESLQPKHCPEPHLTFPRSFKVPPPAPARSSSIPMQESQPIPKQPHARPPLPPCFTIRPAAKAHAGGEAEQRNSPLRQAVTKPAVLTPPPLSPKPGLGLNQGMNPAGRRSPLPGSEMEKVPQPKTAEKDSPPKSESLSANDLDLPPPDYPTCEDNWRDASNLNRLRHELSALLRSPRREERPLEKPAAPRPADSGTDRAGSHGPSLNGSQLNGHAGKDARLSTGGESEKKEVSSSPPSAKGGSPSMAFPAPEGNPATQTCSVMKIRNELEAVLSLKKEGKPALGLSSQKQGTENGSSTPCMRKSPPDLRKSPPDLRKSPLDLRKSPPDLGGSVLLKPAPTPLPAPAAAVEKDEVGYEDHPAPATSKATENLTPAPGSPDSSVSPPDPPHGPAEEPPAPTSPLPPMSPTQSPAPQPNAAIFQYKVHRAGTNSAEPRCTSSSAEPPGPTSSARSPLGTSGAGQEEVLIHPVTGERVERGSPMALLLAARQRAQRGRQGGEVGAALRAKPPPKLSSASSDTTSTSFYRHESKPYSFTVVPRLPTTGTAGSGWSKPPSFSSSSEQGRDVRAVGEAQPPTLPRHRQAAASSLLRSLLESGQPNQPIHGMPREEEENGEAALDYGIIPPPPEFSNEVDEAEGPLPSREENRKCPSFPDCSRGSEAPRYFRWPGYGRGYGGSHELPPPLPSEKSRRNGDFTPQYPDYSSSVGYFSRCPNPRPLIKKRLYVSESDSSYPRAAAAPRGTGTLSSYSPGGYSSAAGEGVRRLGSAHRNGPASAQGRRTSLDAAGKAAPHGSAGADTKYKGQNGDFSPASVVAASRPAHGSLQYGRPTNTFTVRPGARQPISYTYQSGHR
ncbi:uncharacterized protein C6orf132 homolog [Morus bassanus]